MLLWELFLLKRHLKLRNLTDWRIAINKNSVNGTGGQNENEKENEEEKENENESRWLSGENEKEKEHAERMSPDSYWKSMRGIKPEKYLSLYPLQSLNHNTMITFNGWISIEIEDDELNVFERQNELLTLVEAALENVKKHNPFCRVIQPNGNIQIQLAGAHNHDNGYSTDLIELLETISSIAPESYGIIHIHWPEHETLWNEYKVYKLALGKISIEDDSYLSPCNPTIEKT